ncbi:MAG: HPF/RaiA family ribosome-associated protein [Gammaproteobacteria bacterium]
MHHPLQITIRDIDPSENINLHIRERVEKLDELFDKIQRCHVIVELAQKNQSQGKIYNVRIDLKVPRNELAINRIHDENVYVALHKAFDAARRKLLVHLSKQRGEEDWIH